MNNLGKSSMREVAATLGTHYPNMFRVAKPGSAGALGYRPTLKVPSLNELASNIIDRVSLKIMKLLEGGDILGYDDKGGHQIVLVDRVMRHRALARDITGYMDGYMPYDGGGFITRGNV